MRLLASVCNSLAVRSVQARRRAGRGRSAEACPSLRYGYPALLGFGSHRVTHFTRCARCVRTDAVSQRTKRAGTRADPKPAVLGGAYALRPRPARRLAGDDRSWGRVSGKPRASSPRLAARRRRATGRGPGSMPGLRPSPTKNRCFLAKPRAGARWRACAAARSTGFRSARVPARFVN